MSWVGDVTGSGFGLAHLPYGVVRRGAAEPVVACRIGAYALDLAAAERVGLVEAGGAFQRPTLNAFLALGRPEWARVRERITELLADPDHRPAVKPLLHNVSELEYELPIEVADYVDFYSSEHHAANVGRIFRPGQPELLPNWRQLPVGYHGRAGTVVVSGTPVVRPAGQRREGDFGPTARLDIEAELGFVVGVGSALGRPVPAGDFRDHVFGVVLVNDWSARDIQAWEYQPLGPFLAKAFATSVAAWITPLAALDAARVPAPPQAPAVLPYLVERDRYGYDVRMSVSWNGSVVSRPPCAGLYWTPAQQLAHLTVTGARLRPGDLYASGTVSGPTRAEVGSFLELTWGGTEPVTLADGGTRTFLADGDEVVIDATAVGRGGEQIRLAPVRGTIEPSIG